VSHLQANLRTSEHFIKRTFGVPKCLLLTVLFVSKAAGPWVVVDGLLSWCSFHFQLGRTPHIFAHLQEALTNGIWYIACVLCQLAETELEFRFNPGVAN
jgi:hypothetical protein